MEAAAKYLASVTLELGGKSPAVIDESADLRAAAERVAFGKFVNAGQTCVAPDYALVHESVERDFIAELSRVVALFYGETEEARKKSADFPRLIDGAAFRRVKGLLDASVAAGAKIEIGGSADETERYIAPTVLSAVKPDAPIMQEEIFGPVLPVLSFRRREDAIRQIRAGDKPLALYVFGEPQAAEEILRGTTAGGSCVNNALIHLGNPDLPFGGVGASGMGNYHGVHGFRAFSHERAVLVQEMPSLIKLLYPPYGGKLRAIAAAATRLFE
jgi:aldehyde dehydrogenase (NAD+)